MHKEGFALTAILTGVILVVILLVLGIPPVSRGPATQTVMPTVTTTGKGELQLVPSAAIIAVDVVFQAETVTAAESGSSSLARSLSARLKDMGITSTQTISLFDIRQVDETSFSARTSVSISTGSMDEAFRASDLLRKVQGVEIKQVRPVAKDLEQARRQAIQLAVEDARARADEVASVSRLKIKKARHVEVLDVSLPSDKFDTEQRSRPMFLEPLRVVVTVRVVWDAQ